MGLFHSDFQVEVCTFEHDRNFVGLKRRLNDDLLFKEGPEIANQYAKIKESIQHLVLPVITIAAMHKKDEEGYFDYFFGDEVTRVMKLKEPLSSLKIVKGTQYAKVSVKVGNSVTLAYRVAKLRQRFYTEWLPASGYQKGTLIEDMEVYKYRKRKFRRAKKLVMDLYFVLEKGE